MVKLNRQKPINPLVPHLMVATVAWAGLIWTILMIEPGSFLAYLTFFGLAAMAVAFTATLLLFLSSQRSTQNRQFALNQSRRRAWLLALGVLVLSILQLYRLTSPVNSILIIATLILLEIYLSQSP